jgi:uncharacterized protein DUF4412
MPNKSILVAAIAVVAATPMSAQIAPNFQGVIHFSTEWNGKPMDVVYMVRGAKVRQEMPTPMGRLVMLIDVSMGETMIVDEAHKVYRVFKASDASDVTPATFTRLGTKEHVAGYDCEYFHVESDYTRADVCAATGLGMFNGGRDTPWVPQSAAMRELAAKNPEYARLLHDGFVPLKVRASMPDGSRPMTMVATSVERRVVDETLVTLPAGYTKIEMPTVPGRP